MEWVEGSDWRVEGWRYGVLDREVGRMGNLVDSGQLEIQVVLDLGH